jgi:hypothetical protein
LFNIIFIFMAIINSGSFTISFLNEFPIYEEQIRCTVKEEEFNTSYNLTLQNSSGSLLNFATGSFFKPYVTTVGLYNDNNELLAVAKLARPIPMASNIEMIFVIKLDK